MKKFSYSLPAEIRSAKKRAWLTAYAACGGICRACAASQVHHSTYYEWLKQDPLFAATVAEVKDHYTEILEAEADKRATRAKSPSDVLLIFRLKALRPEMYRERHDVKINEHEVNREIEDLIGRLRERATLADGNGVVGNGAPD